MKKNIIVKECINGVFSEKKCRVNEEVMLKLNVNGKLLLSIMCSPWQLEDMILGLLFCEQIIKTTSDIKSLEVNKVDMIANVELFFNIPLQIKENIRTSGFGNGTTFNSKINEVPTLHNCECKLTTSELMQLIKKKEEKEEVYRKCRGIHSSALCINNKIVAFSEDIGRHNTLDKVVGQVLTKISKNGMVYNENTKNVVLITSGRISSEMIKKVAKLKIPILVSMSAATNLAIDIANYADITLIGYCRNDRFLIYNDSGRIVN